MHRKATGDLEERLNTNLGDSYETPAKELEKTGGKIRVLRKGSCDLRNDRIEDKIEKMSGLQHQQ